MSSLSIHDGDQGQGHPAAPPAQSQPGPGRILTVAFATGQAAVAASSRSLALQLLSRFMPDETRFPACPGTRHDERGNRQVRQQAGRSLEVSSIGKVQDEIAPEPKADQFADPPVPQAAWPGRELLSFSSSPDRLAVLEFEPLAPSTTRVFRPAAVMLQGTQSMRPLSLDFGRLPRRMRVLPSLPSQPSWRPRLSLVLPEVCCERRGCDAEAFAPQFPGDLIEGVSPFLQFPDFAGEHPDRLPRGVVLPLDGRQSAELAFDLPDLPGRVPCHRPPRVLAIRSPVDRMIANCQAGVMSIHSSAFTGWGLSYTCSAYPDQTTPSIRRFASHLRLNPGKGPPPLHPGPLGVSLLAAPCGCPPFTSNRAA